MLARVASLALAACSRPSGDAGTPPAATAASNGGAQAIASPDAAEDPQIGAARARVQAWSRALDAHDVTALETLYARSVCLYGRIMTRANVLDAKRAALGPQSTFHQVIVGDIELRAQADGAVIALFVKRSGEKDHLRDLPAKLVLRSRGAPAALEIVQEADAPDRAASDKRDACEAQAWHESEGSSPAAMDACEETAAKAVRALTPVKAFLHDAKTSAGAGAVLGGIGPEDDGDGVLTSAIGFQTPDRFEPHIVYTVDRKTGALTVSVDGEDETVPNEARKSVTDACKK